MPPLVSVLLPNYNHAAYLPRRLESIRQQTFTDFELIALDDCSSDDSRVVLQDHARRMPMQLILNDRNSGSPFVQWRRGAEAATGKYLWIAESDDFADPRLLEVLVGRMEMNPNTGVSYCQSFIVNEVDEVLRTFDFFRQGVPRERWDADYINNGRDEVAKYLVRQNTVPNASAVVVRRDLLLDACIRLPNMRLSGDWWIWATVMLQSNVAYTAKPLNYFRTHASSVRSSTKRATTAIEWLRILAYICEQVEVSTATRKEVLEEVLDLVWKCLIDRETTVSREWLAELRSLGLKVHPSAGRRLSYLQAKRRVKQIAIADWLRQRLKRTPGSTL